MTVGNPWPLLGSRIIPAGLNGCSWPWLGKAGQVHSTIL